MAQSMFLFGAAGKIAALLNLMAARAQNRGAVVFIDPVGVFDAEYVLDEQGSVTNVSLCRPRSAYQLRALLDTKLPKAHAGRPPFLVVVSCATALFEPVDAGELQFVVDYTVDALLDLVDPDGTVVFATSQQVQAAAKQVQARCDITIDVDVVSKSADSMRNI